MVFQPLTQITSTLNKPKKKYEHKLKINNSTLPLTYIELKGFQIIIPSTTTKPLHDMAVLQIDRIILNPNPENPICRIPCRSDLYEKAAQSRLLHVPGNLIYTYLYLVLCDLLMCLIFLQSCQFFFKFTHLAV